MFLKEFEGESLFRKFNIPVPRCALFNVVDKKTGNLREKIDEFLGAMPDILEFAVKAQLLRGKRGKSGGISFVSRDDVLSTVGEMLESEFGGEAVEEVLVVEKLDIKREIYLSMAVDRFNGCPVLIFSMEGGIDIEDLAAKSPNKIFKFLIPEINRWDESSFNDVLLRLIDDHDVAVNIKAVALKLFEMLIKEDLILAEINPLILCKDGSLYAADAKLIVDDNAIFRHSDYALMMKREQSALEFMAKEWGLSYVELDGDLAVIGNGAGLVMATLDAVNDYGGKPANFCDIGGGASSEMMEKALDIVLQKKSVKGLLINIFGGITHCDEIARGIVNFFDKKKTKIPMIVRIIGTNDNEAVTLLKKSGIDAFDSFEKAVKKAASLI